MHQRSEYALLIFKPGHVAIAADIQSEPVRWINVCVCVEKEEKEDRETKASRELMNFHEYSTELNAFGDSLLRACSLSSSYIAYT